MIFSEDQLALKTAAEKFARDILLPGYQKRETQPFDRDLAREMGAMGLIGTDLPEELGGLGDSSITTGMVSEALALGDFNMSALPVNVSLNAAVLMQHAPKEITDEWVPRMIAGEKLMAICLTEPRGGSDAARIELRAKKRGMDYVLTGEKTSITFADCADIFLVFARTGSVEEGAKGVTAFFIPEGTPGIARLKFDDVGHKCVGRGSLFFEDVVIPEWCRLGAEGTGFTQVMHGFDYSRALIALECAGAAQASLDEAWAYVKDRQAFGRPIGQFQGVSFPLAEGESMITAIRQLAYQTLQLREAGLPHTSEAAMCKWMGPKHAVEVIHNCLLASGHYGYSYDLPHQQRMRDVMGLEIGDGTAGVMKQIIARQKIGRAAVPY
ncbi:Acyl-CoA dehydrogenase [Marinovum algicola]|uniref:Cyclohexanecarboxyl-CoA dehydrogenase n=1 Tax=Marinovum algicola TaxID=42444 RepID=A0A975WBU1_9RHOB|nr:acyl-CoA dehydrogenase family protein [Marinovum algicola]SEJ82597.1 cyclohexanecarboxyl-CoA dehydrogenase [Marinovum algicola]SLN62882.1 Acyl-CoA dehydrogenase [Marinovum algicola]